MKLFAGSILIGLCCLAGVGTGQEEKWVSLFDGKSLAGWTTMDKKPVTQGWVMEDGVLHRASKGGDMYTEKEYTNFVFEFEWKVTDNTNSGVKYRMTSYGKEYLGPEYQVLDDSTPGNQKLKPRFHTAAIYEIMPCNDKKNLKPVGEWNTGRIVANGSKIEHWLNGEKVVDIDTTSEEYARGLAGSKFAKYPNFGKNPSGRIMLQDHGTEVWFKNVRIRELP